LRHGVDPRSIETKGRVGGRVGVGGGVGVRGGQVMKGGAAGTTAEKMPGSGTAAAVAARSVTPVASHGGVVGDEVGPPGAHVMSELGQRLSGLPPVVLKVASDDGTQKLLLRLADGLEVVIKDRVGGSGGDQRQCWWNWW
jgi:hypothetical protein